jgi:peptidoglycan/xylan/chitin deacetylase (PgdA/CDA1 family)
VKAFALYLSRLFGLFYVASRFTAQQPRILCYHGVSLEDEHRFRPGLFLRGETFASRLRLLRKWSMRPVTLDALYEAAGKGYFESGMVVVTIDDGWAGIAQGMLPELAKHGYPATLYLSSYFVNARRPVFKVAVAYLFWKYGCRFEPRNDSRISMFNSCTMLDLEQVLEIAKAMGSQWEQPILEELCEYFGESLDSWRRSGKFHFLDAETIRALAAEGLNVELHTHRHRFSELDCAAAAREIAANSLYIKSLTGRCPRHFCFPRGEYRPEQLSILQSAGILTATTTRNELVSLSDSRLEWPRIVDSESVTELEFEAELTGFMSILRRLRRAWSLQ